MSADASAQPPSYRVFIASPGDVEAERLRAALILQRLARKHARRLRIEAYLWEYEPMLASGHFEDLIEAPSAHDLVVVILWSRLGTALPACTAVREYRGLDGRTPVTGTEWEFEDALRSSRENGKPDIAVFRRKDAPRVPLDNDAERQQIESQWQMLCAFWESHFEEGGRAMTAYTPFSDLADFESRFEATLESLVEERIKNNSAAGVHPLVDNPFRGMQAYEYEHASLFFGRDGQVQKAVQQLVSAADGGCAFLLVLGASGTGKSSLVQAGVLPVLEAPGVLSGVGHCRRAVMRPAAHQDGPWAALANALLTEHALPEIASTDERRRRLPEALRQNALEMIRRALEDATHAARTQGGILQHETLRLVLVVDQLEELYTATALSEGERREWIATLACIAHSGVAYVIATLRSDYWHRVSQTPQLVELSDHERRLELLPATPAEIADIVRGAAAAAGLSFDRHPENGLSLDAVLVEEAAREPGSLPLLSYLLDALYRQDVEGTHNRILRHATAERLGGLRGAIAHRAEECLDEQEIGVRSAFPTLLRALVTVPRDRGAPTARSASLADFHAGSPSRRLADAMLDPKYRLLVASGDDAGRRVRIAHEALLGNWQRAARQIEQDRGDLELRTRLESAEARWSSHGYQEDLMIPTGLPLDEARDLCSRRRDELHRSVLMYVDASSDLEERQRTAKEAERQKVLEERAAATLKVQRRTQIAAIALLLGSCVALVLARLAYEQRQDARRQSSDADYRLASLKLSAQSTAAPPEWQSALAYLARALRSNPENHAAESLGWNVVLAHPATKRVLRLPSRLVVSDHALAAFSPDGGRIVAAGGHIARIWDTRIGAAVGEPMQHGEQGRHIRAIAFSPDGQRVLTASSDGTARLWNAETGAAALSALEHRTGVQSAEFSADGERIVTSADSQIRVWSAGTGEPLTAPLEHDTEVKFAQFSPSGDELMSLTDESLVLWRLRDEGPMSEELHRGELESFSFSADGQYVAAASTGAAYVWNVSTGQQIGPLIHGFIEHAQIGPGNRYVATSSPYAIRKWDLRTGKMIDDSAWTIETGSTAPAFDAGAERTVFSNFGTLRLWDVSSRRPYSAGLGVGSLNLADFSPYGPWLLTILSSGARVWDSRTGAALTEALWTGGSALAQLGPDGRSVAIIKSFTPNGEVSLWDITKRPPRPAVVGKAAAANAAVISADGHRAAIAERARIGIWDTANGTAVGAVSVDPDFTPLSFSPDGSRLILRSRNSLRRVADVESGELSDALPWAISPDGRYFLSSAGESTLQLREVNTGQAVGQLLSTDGEVGGVEFSPGSDRVLAVTKRSIQVWDARSGRTLTTPSAIEGEAVRSAWFSSDGNRILTIDDDQTVSVWNVSASMGRPLSLPQTGEIDVVVFSPDGARLLTASHEGDVQSVRILDGRTGVVLVNLVGHTGPVTSAQFSADGGRVVTASYDHTVRIWDARSGLPLSEPLEHGESVYSATFSEHGQRVVTVSGGLKELGTVRVWDVFQSENPAPDWVADYFERVAGQRINGKGLTELSVGDPSEVLQRSTHKADIRKIYAEWLLADPTTRPPSPLSKDAHQQ